MYNKVLFEYFWKFEFRKVSIWLILAPKQRI